MGFFNKKNDDEYENDIVDIDNNEEMTVADKANNTDEIEFDLESFKQNFGKKSSNSDALDLIKKKVVKENTPENIENSETTAVSKDSDYESLLDKCKAYTVDENGVDVSNNTAPLYKLKSVAEILKSSQQRSLDDLSKKYNIQIKNIEETAAEDELPFEEAEEPTQQDDKRTPAFVDIINKNPAEEISDDQKFEDYIIMNNSDAVKVQMDSDIPDISDIDNTQRIDTNIHDHSDSGATIRYTPIKQNNSNNSYISVSSITQNVDLGDKFEIVDNDNNLSNNSDSFIENNFEEFAVDKEIKNYDDVISNIGFLFKLRRKNFLLCVFSSLVSVIFAVFAINIFQDLMCENRVIISVFSALFLLNSILNFDMFKSLKNMFSKNATSDISVSVLSIATFITLIFNILKFSADDVFEIYIIALFSSIILTVRTFAKFFDISSKLYSLKVLSTKNHVNAIDFIDDQNIAYSIAKDSVDGDILIAAPHKTKFINSFKKYTEYTHILNGKFYIYQLVGILFGVLSAIIGYFDFHSVNLSLCCLLSVLLIFSCPILFFINVLPFYSVSKKLHKFGAGIFGEEGAYQIDTANSAILSTSELFPAGSIILKDIKVLSENSIDDTILKATSLTETVDSPLAPIFKQIAKTNIAYTLPDSDTVKYEDKLGLSGWVDNELLFIGNRALMESHGIEIPGFEVDRKILTNGCFPVYLATVDKACALLIIKYNPIYSIAKELRKLTGLGVTLLFTNTDPNINESMIADHFDLYEDSIKIVSNAGKCMYNNVTFSDDEMSAPAVFKRKNLGVVRIMNAASSFRKSNLLLSIMYIIATVIFAVGYVYLKFASDNSFFNSGVLILGELAVTLFTLILYLFRKP